LKQKILAILVLFFLFLFTSCKKVDTDEINNKKEIIIEHLWGTPVVVYGNTTHGSIFVSEPIDFFSNGSVTIATNYIDYWDFLNENTVRFIETGLNWQILTINDSILHVDVIRTENAEFLFECTYLSLD